jgi:hypothetical protein
MLASGQCCLTSEIFLAEHNLKKTKLWDAALKSKKGKLYFEVRAHAFQDLATLITMSVFLWGKVIKPNCTFPGQNWLTLLHS